MIRSVLLLTFVVAVPTVHAADWSYRGHAKYRPSLTVFDNATANQTQNAADVRLALHTRRDAWDAEVHYELLALAGDADGIAPLPDDWRRLLDLTDSLADADNLAAVQRLDRLNVGYAGANLVVRVGRQAVSWGNSFVYNPMDIFNPFAPTAVDKDYKTGDDMVYAQWLLPSGNDWQSVAVVRRDVTTGDVSAGASSLAFKYHGVTSRGDVDVLAAQHYGEPMLGVGFAAPWRESVWRMEGTAARIGAGETAFALTANADYSWNWGGFNVYGFSEYHHNSLGQTRIDPFDVSEALSQRRSRGEVFTLGRDYLSAGLQIELAALLHLSPTLIWNLHDHSGLIPVRLTYDWRENVVVNGGLNLSFGASDSEFHDPVSSQSAYIQLAYYF